MRVSLEHVALPEIGVPDQRPDVPASEATRRVDGLYARASVDWVVVYGDREHGQNLAYLCGFDPRFEEAVLLLGPGDARILLVGNEGVTHAAACTLPVDVVLCQSFSLMGQTRERAPRLRDVLADAGIRMGQTVSVIGWKYLEAFESDRPSAPSFVPAVLVSVLDELTGGSASDGTSLLMHPTTGARTRNTVLEVAQLEWAAARASAAVRRVMLATQPGLSEQECVAAMGYAGEPLSCHVIYASGAGAVDGLRSPTSRRLALGDAVVNAIGYWGGLTCRAGLVQAVPDPAYVQAVVEPYFGAIATWYQTIGIGVSGGAVYAAIDAALADASFGSMLNPGHQIALEEWIHSPIQPGDERPLSSGMAFQCDIIPSPLPPGWLINCEDTIVLADDSLRAELTRDYPDVWRRIEDRRAFMRERLGLVLRPEILPLSNTPAYLPPFWLDPTLVCIADG